MRMHFVRTLEQSVDVLIRRFSSFPWAVSFVIVVVAGLLAPINGADPDLFARLAVGRLVAEQGGMPLVDPFSFSPIHPRWIDHEWLSGVVFWQVWSTFGDGGLLLLRLILAMVCAAAILCAAKQVQNQLSMSVVLWVTYGLAGLTFAFASVVRCQAFTYTFVALLSWATIAYLQTGRLRLLVWMPALLALWANLHGGFVLGLGILGAVTLSAYLQSPRLWRFWLPPLVVLICCVLATGLNPYGLFAYWEYIIKALTMPRPSISEWAPIDWASSPPLILLSVPVVIGVMLSISQGQRRPSSAVGWLGLLLILGSLAFALRQVRLLALLATMVAIFGWPAMTAVMDKLRAAPLLGSRWPVLSRAIFIGALLLWVLSIIQVFSSPKVLDRSSYPEAAITFLKQLPVSDGRLLVDFNNGSYALFHLYPSYRVSLDGRYEETYPESTRQLVERALLRTGQERRQALSELKPTHALISLTSDRDGFDEAWGEIFCDKTWCVLEHNYPNQ